jgi:hypothetical protein
MRGMTNLMRVSLAAIVGSAAIALHHAPRAATPYEVTIIARDYAFDAPDSIPAGVTTIRLENHGPSIHHLAIVRLDSGHTAQDFTAVMAGHDPWPAWITFLGGPNAPPPGGAATATVNLEPGQYLITCLVHTPGGAPGEMVSHVVRGMVRPLTVTGALRMTALPRADATITLVDYGFTMSHQLFAGRQTILVRNTAAQAHEIFLARLAPGKTAADLVTWIRDQQNGPPPIIPVGGLTPISPNIDAEMTVDLVPGEYGLWCFVPDARDGAMHVVHGMVRQITVLPPLYVQHGH